MAVTRNARLTCSRMLRWTLLVAGALSLDNVEAGGKRLAPAEEPQGQQPNKIFRLVFADKKFYNLRAAGVLKDEEIPHFYEEDQTNLDSYINSTFEFHSSDLLQKISIINWHVPLLDRSALHVYDDPKDVQLASGPQVDQSMCGLHLDYMNHMVRKHMKNFANSTELTIFLLMNSFATPHYWVSEGTTVFPGGYQTCKDVKLNIIRKELYQVDPIGSARYFSGAVESDDDGILKSLRRSIGPFIGYKPLYEYGSIEEHSKTIRMQPMRYCMAGLRWPIWGNSSFQRRNFVYRIGVCLPDTCDSKSLDLYNDKIKQLTDTITSQFYDGYYIDQLYCLPDERSPMRNPFNYLSTVLCIAFNLIWLSTVLIVTLVTSLRRRSARLSTKQKAGESKQTSRSSYVRILGDFDLVRNFHDLRSIKLTDDVTSETGLVKSKSKSKNKDHPRVLLQPLEGLKVFGSMSVINSHHFMVFLGRIWNVHSIRFITESLFMPLATTAPAIVNIFFVITGILTTNVVFKKPKSVIMQPMFWLKFIFFRYVRIVPLYLLMHWFLKSTFRFLSNGPYWDYGTSHTGWSKICQDESYWTVILPHANHVSPGQHCNGVGWYIANDLQLILITPFMIILLYSKPIIGYLVAIGSIMIAALNHVSYFLENEVDPRATFEWNFINLTRVTFDTFVGYTALRFRFVAYFIGLLAGHLLYLYNNGTISEWPKWFIITAKILIYGCTYLLFFLWSLLGMLLVYDDATIRLINAILEGFHHTLSSLAIASFVILLCTNHFPSLARFFGHRYFMVLAKMALSTTLVHMPLIYYKGMSQVFPPYVDWFAYSEFIFQVAESFFVAAFLYLFYEVPLRKLSMRVINKLFESDSSRRKSE